MKSQKRKKIQRTKSKNKMSTTTTNNKWISKRMTIMIKNRIKRMKTRITKTIRTRRRKVKIKREVIQVPRTIKLVSFKLWVERSVLINFATQKKFIRKSDQKLKLSVTDFFAKIVTKTMWIIHFVSFASKFIQTTKMNKMTPNGLVAINVNDG